jgi:hypothetical protein
VSEIVEDFERQDFPRKDYMDGNAAAGVFSNIFAADITSARGKCVNCGNEAVVAAARLYPDDHGMVLRCSSCESVLVRVVETDHSTCLDLRGLSFLEIFS